jgi:adenylyl- and sulfurtransferase ThiI
MMERYTVLEIDEMRSAIKRYAFHPLSSYDPKERIIEVEEMLRTYLLASVPYEGFETALKERYLGWKKKLEEAMEKRKAK